MSGSRSSTTSENRSEQNTSNEQLALQDFEGLGIQGNDGNVTVNQTADGAFEIVGRTTEAAIAAGERTAELSERLGFGAFDFAGDVLDGSHTFARENVRDSLDFSAGAMDRSFDFGEQSLEAMTGLVSQVTDANNDTLAGTVGALQDITREQNTSLEARNQKLVTIVVIAVVLLAGIQQFFSNRKKG